MAKSTKRSVNFVEGSGNVFADLGLPNPELLLAKATLVAKLQLILDARKLTTTRAAALLDIDPHKLEDLLAGQTQRFTLDRLFRFLNVLGQDVEIAIAPSKNGHHPIRVK